LLSGENSRTFRVEGVVPSVGLPYILVEILSVIFPVCELK